MNNLKLYFSLLAKCILLKINFFSLGGPFPDLEITHPHNDQVILSLMNFLEQRINKRNMLRADLEQKRKYLD